MGAVLYCLDNELKKVPSMTGAREREHILVVDDDRLVLEMLAEGLRNAGYHVSEAGDCASALAAVALDKPDLALLDVRLPDMPGVNLAERLAADHDVPFMFLSAYDDAETIQHATRVGALGYLVKPLYAPQLVPSIEAALARAAQIRALKTTGDQLSHALESGRETNMAVGILMERLGVDRIAAFEALRVSARSQRRRVHEVSADVVTALETLNKLNVNRD
ncbi:MAG: response regulator [Betaproteobacteria bacterium]|nr:response regulator [Betaproteobacteria bacterium]